MSLPVEIIEYHASHQPAFARLNKAWLQQYFEVTPLDEYELAQPEVSILQAGGVILCARQGADIVGVVALRGYGAGVLQLAKLAVDQSCRGQGAGRLLCEAALARARQRGAHTVVLHTNEQLAAALALYHKLGFTQVPLGKVAFARATLKMQLSLV
jgi:ribosomal protein S18 acetylase RimI-like enzyme